MSHAALTAPAAAPPRLPAATQRGRHWLVGPWFDLLFVANALWPLILLVPFGESFAGPSGVQFWQLYFVTTPHRWITLLLVFGDRTRFRERPAVFLGIAAAVIGVCLTVRTTTGALTCLLTVDYVWNAWHFAAQHYGVYRIYTRLEDPQRRQGLGYEKWALRLFLLYVTLRVAGATWGLPRVEAALQMADYGILFLPILLGGKLCGREAERPEADSLIWPV